MVKFIFDENCIQGESVIAMGLHFTNLVEIGTRQYMCCLKPYAWICTTVINLVVIQLTKKQRTKYPNGRHRIWYMSEYASQMIIKNEEYEGNNERVADLFFKNKGYTGPIDACEEVVVWNTQEWDKKKSKMLQLYDGRSPSENFHTHVLFHQNQEHFLTVHVTHLAIYETTELNRVKQCVNGPFRAQISHATFSCDSQLIYASFVDGTVLIFNASIFHLRCEINPTVYIPSELRY
ncbi:hypothetical protein RHGRI_011962 [Rhododendron griersonianum]|uniref:Uncharacterized protein n=1 Tax=Rhododendron griersonianum TaxID=479676 RepID=A0AAV6KNU5_9ERIC|nr:hypothetical protein RHGRI_011962 [Rhododendron griersonianum]